MPEQNPPKNIVRPILVAALMCDAAAIEPHTGKKTLIGIFNRINSRKLPASRTAFLYFKFINAVGEYDFEIRNVRSSTREIIGGASGHITVKDKLKSGDYIAPLENILFPDFGRYEFQILFNEMLIGSAIIDVEQMKGD